jgi:adenosylhomocysteine nucleosidase
VRVLVTFAVDAEFAPWRKIRHFAMSHDGFGKVYLARFNEVEAHVLLTGIGAKSAWLDSFKRFKVGGMDFCISSGLAGGLRPEYRPGDILTPTLVRSEALRKNISCDPALRSVAVASGAREVASFCSTDTVRLSAAEKQKLGREADAVEMESGAVLYEADALGARVVAIRGISDAVEEALPLDFNRVTTAVGEVSMSRVLGQVARSPGKVPSLIRFGQQSRLAAEKLCAFLDQYLQGLAKAVPEIAREAVK